MQNSISQLAMCDLEFRIPVKDYVQRFFCVEYPNGIDLMQRQEIGQIVLAMLEETPAGWKYQPWPSELPFVLLTLRNADAGKKYAMNRPFLPERGVRLCSQVLMRVFRNSLVDDIQAAKRRGVAKELPALRAFRSRYGISEDMYPEDHHYRSYKNWKAERLRL